MWRSYAALACARLGERERARALVEEELEIGRRFGAPEPIGEALRVRALLAPGDEMAEAAREAVEVLAASDLQLAHARALIDLGAALRRGGHRRDAREPLREGLDLANRCGSVIETDRAMDELRACGARPRRPLVRGVDSLSPQERRIASLATEGLSNREIAEALFLTRRTVEMHLTGAYRKLGVAGPRRPSWGPRGPRKDRLSHGRRCVRKNSQNSGAASNPASLLPTCGYLCSSPASTEKRNTPPPGPSPTAGQRKAVESGSASVPTRFLSSPSVARWSSTVVPTTGSAQQRQRLERQLGQRRRAGVGQDAVVERAGDEPHRGRPLRRLGGGQRAAGEGGRGEQL